MENFTPPAALPYCITGILTLIPCDAASRRST